jgi:hypothetical protein
MGCVDFRYDGRFLCIRAPQDHWTLVHENDVSVFDDFK